MAKGSRLRCGANGVFKAEGRVIEVNIEAHEQGSSSEVTIKFTIRLIV